MRGTIEVHRFLVERDIPHEFYRLDRPLRRIDEAAVVLALDPRQVAMAELFEARPSPVLALTRADECASLDALAAAARVSRLRPAQPDRVLAVSGYLPHWLPPVGHERAFHVVIEEGLLFEPVLYAAGGDPGVMLVIRSEDLLRATAATPAPLTRAAEESAERRAAG